MSGRTAWPLHPVHSLGCAPRVRNEGKKKKNKDKRREGPQEMKKANERREEEGMAMEGTALNI